MKFIEDRDGFLNEGAKYRTNEERRKVGIENVFKLISHLYDYFIGLDNIWVSAKDLQLKQLIRKYNVGVDTPAMKVFLMFKGKNTARVYCLNDVKQKPTKKIAEKIFDLHRVNTSNAVKSRTAAIVKHVKYKNEHITVKIKACLVEIKKQIELKHGDIILGNILKSYYIIADYAKYFVKLNICYNYSLKKDKATLTQIEKYFSKAWQPELGFPAFSEVKHRLYVWNAGKITDEMAQSIVDERNKYNNNLRKEDSDRRAAVNKTAYGSRVKAESSGTPEEIKAKLIARNTSSAARKRAVRATESPEEREIRLNKIRAYNNKKESEMTPKEKEEFLKKRREYYHKNKKKK